jgi:hypothetical protein
MLVMMVVLIISWAMMLNIAKLLTDRMILQNAADNAALSVATSKARLLNQLGELNFMIGCLLYGSEAGFANYHTGGITGGLYGICAQVLAAADYQYFSDNQQRVASILDVPHGFCSGIDEGYNESNRFIAGIYGLVNAMIIKQDLLMGQFINSFVFSGPSSPMIQIAQSQDANSNSSKDPTVDSVFILTPSSVLLLDMPRNANGVSYCQTDSVCISVPPPFGAYHAHIFWAQEWQRVNASWLYADRDSFYKNQTITVLAVKNRDSISNKGFPIFGRWLGIQWPEMYAISTAGIYNREGPMFPVEQKGSPSDRILPVIESFRKAQHGGWDVHLVRTKKVNLFGLPIPIPAVQH